MNHDVEVLGSQASQGSKRRREGRVRPGAVHPLVDVLAPQHRQVCAFRSIVNAQIGPT
jgi:hypothetical protein